MVLDFASSLLLWLSLVALSIPESGVDPSTRRKVEKIAQSETFEAIAREWFATFSVNFVHPGERATRVRSSETLLCFRI